MASKDNIIEIWIKKAKGEDFRAFIEEHCRVKEEAVSLPEPAKEKWNLFG